MRQLHFVGFTSDHEGLLLSSDEEATSGDYFVQIDEYLAAAVEQRPGASADGTDRRDRPQEPKEQEPEQPAQRPVRRSSPRTTPRPASDLSPREIQARLRAGNSVAEVAAEAGVAEDWVLRFADPIIAEQARVVERAQQLTFTKPRVGPSAEPLRTSVRWNLHRQGALRDDEVFDAGWSAYNLHGPRWVVRFAFSAKRRRKLAEWEVDLRQGEITARNRVATDLAYVEPGRRRKPPPDELPDPHSGPSAGARPARKRGSTRGRTSAPARPARAAGKVPANKGAPRKSTVKRRAPTKAASKGSAAITASRASTQKSARKSPPARPARKRVSTTTAPVKNLASPKAVATKAVTTKAVAKKVTSKKAAPKKAAVKKAVAEKAAPKKAPGKKAPGNKTPGKKAPGKKAPGKKAPGKKMTSKKKAVGKKAAKKAPAARTSSSLHAEPVSFDVMASVPLPERPSQPARRLFSRRSRRRA